MKGLISHILRQGSLFLSNKRSTRYFISLSLFMWLFSASYVVAKPVNEYSFSVSQGALQMQLQTVANQANVFFIGDMNLVNHLQGEAFSGRFTVDDAFRKILINTPLYMLKDSNGVYVLKQSTTEDTIVVTEQTNSDVVTENSRSYTIKSMSTASKLDLSPRQTPQSVSVITREQVKEQNMTSLEDALLQTTGVNVIYEGSYQARFQSRGFTMDNIQEDGVSRSEQNSVFGGAQSSSDSLDLAIYDHIEILRGASGLTQNSGEPGGTVNLVRKKPTYNPQGSIKLSGGSWDNYRSEIDLSGALFDSQSIRGRLVAVLQDKGSFIDYVNSKRELVYGTVAFDFSPSTTLLLGVQWQKSQTVPDLYGLPMSTDYQSLALPRSTFLGAKWNQMTFEKTNIFMEFEHLLSNDWLFKSAVNYTHHTGQGKFIGIMGNGTKGVDDTGQAKLNNALQRDNSAKQWGIDVNLTIPLTLWEHEHQIVIGGDYQKENYDNRFGIIANTDPVNLYTWDPSSVAEPNWPDYRYRFQYARYQQSLYANSKFTVFDDLSILIGARYSRFSQDYDRLDYTANSHSHSRYMERDKLIPYAGIVWDFLPDYSWYLSYSDIYKPQNLQDRHGDLLPSVTGTNYETGIKGEFFDGNLNASITLFRIIQKNRGVDDISCTGSTYCYVADGKVRSQGVELELAGNLTSRWKAFVGYTYNKSKYLETEPNTNYHKGDIYSKHTPRQMLKLYTSYDFDNKLSGLTVGAGLTAQSDTNTNYNIKQAGYVLFNANADYQFTDHLSLNLALKNITDKVYYLSVSNRHRGGNNFYGEPRNFVLTATYQF